MDHPPTTRVQEFAGRFVAACERHPGLPAADDGLIVCDYAGLLGLARAVAATISERVPDTGVAAVIATKTVWGLAACFGVALSGRSALLLDPDDPPRWWAERAARVGASVIVADDVVPVDQAGMVPLARIGPGDCPPRPFGSPPAAATADPWILCTSGSTGVPKFVWSSDATMTGAWDRLSTRAAAHGVSGRVPVLPPLAFAAARVPLFQALAAGACAVLVDTARRTPGEIVDVVADVATHHLYADPTMLRALLGVLGSRGTELPAIQQLEVAGAAVLVDDVVAIRRGFPNAHLTVHYGSTELGTVTTLHLDPDVDATEPGALAGTVQPGRRVRVADDDGTVCATGAPGELWVASDVGVGEYRDDPDLARRARLVDPDGTVWRRTGDRARVLDDGRVEVLGREDDRVKVNGVPVDLNVVAEAVAALDGVADAAVSAVAVDGDTRLVAWVVMKADHRPTVRDLRAGLGAVLPRSMQPHLFRAIGAIPHTSRGKVDRMALQSAAARELPTGVAHVPARTPVEAMLASRFRVRLGVDDVGVHETFFELGGDSLDALELVSALVDELGLTPEQQTHLEHALVTDGSVAALAAVLEDPAAPATGRVELRSDGVVRLALRDDRVPGSATVVLIPGGGQTPVALRPLVTHLEGRRVWTVLPPGFRPGSLTDATVEDLAGRYADAVLAAAPARDFVVAGFSFGGLLAYELARVLDERGARVRAVALLDTECPGTSREPPRPGWPTRLRRKWRHLPTALRARVRRRRAPAPVQPPMADPPPGVDALPSETMAWARALMAAYDPPTSEVGALVVRCAQAAAAGAPPDLGWSRLCRGRLQVLDVPGNHLDVLREPAVARIGAALAAAAVT